MCRIAGGVRVFALFLIGLAAVSAVTSADAEDPNISVVEGYVTSVQAPDSFVVKHVHVVAPMAADFLLLNASAKQSGEISHQIAVGMYVRVIGKTDWATHDLVASEVRVRDDAGKSILARGVIDRVLRTGAESVFRADGYAVHVNSETDIHFAGGLTSLQEVGANTWLQFQGKEDDQGEVVAFKASFAKLNLHKRKPSHSVVQAMSIPAGTFIDYDGSFYTDRGKYRKEDIGGWCGWYPLVDDSKLQERVRRIGMSVVPQYQRDLSEDDPTRIPFRFYVVDEPILRTDIFCSEGLILIPLRAIQRLQSDDQLAALLADGVAGEMERQKETLARELSFVGLVESAVYVAGSAAAYDATLAGGLLVKHALVRKQEDERGRVELGLMADAGYDPVQAAEAWRLLAPGKLPKDLAKLKYPARSDYLLGFLRSQHPHSSAKPSSGVLPPGSGIDSDAKGDDK